MVAFIFHLIFWNVVNYATTHVYGTYGDNDWIIEADVATQSGHTFNNLGKSTGSCSYQVNIVLCYVSVEQEGWMIQLSTLI